MKSKLPEFLREYDCDIVDLERIRARMGSWLTIHAHVRKFEDSRRSMANLAYMMIAEYTREAGARMDIIVRLHGRYNHMRYNLERVEVGARR